MGVGLEFKVYCYDESKKVIFSVASVGIMAAPWCHNPGCLGLWNTEHGLLFPTSPLTQITFHCFLYSCSLFKPSSTRRPLYIQRCACLLSVSAVYFFHSFKLKPLCLPHISSHATDCASAFTECLGAMSAILFEGHCSFLTRSLYLI